MSERLSSVPVAPHERSVLLDVLRGFALFGILLINHQALMPAEGLRFSGFDPQLGFLIEVLVEKKFYSLFSLLFGLGFAIFLDRRASRGDTGTSLYRRRLVGLLVIGLLHTSLLWFGDILTFYAIIGFLLIPFRRLSDRALLRAGVIVLILPIPLYALIATAVATLGLVGESATDTPPEILTEAIAALASGSYADIVRTNLLLTAAGAVVRLISSMQAVRVLGMFLLGYWMGRTKVFVSVDAHRTVLVRLIAVAVLVGLPISIAMAWLPSGDPLLPTMNGLPQMTAATVATPILALGYAAAIALAFQRVAFRPWLAWLAPAGRMALTNYLVQSVALFVIYYGTGFGLFDRASLAVRVGISVALFLTQCLASRWWLSRFEYGPVEWLWRQFTYRRRIPIRREA